MIVSGGAVLVIRPPVRYCPADSEGVNRRCSGCFQGFGALIERRPGGENIIDDQDRAASHFACIRHMEGISDILEAFFPIQPRLRFRPALSDQNVKADRQTQPAPTNLGKESGLIEASLLQTFDMERNGKNHIHSG